MQHPAAHCNTLQHSATLCNTENYAWLAAAGMPRCNTWHNRPQQTRQHTATHCNTLQHTLQYTLQHTQQHTAALCSTLQHTAKQRLTHGLWQRGCHSAIHYSTHCNTHCNMLCNTLYNTPCNTLQHTNVRMPCGSSDTTMQYPATHIATLQLTVHYCN